MKNANLWEKDELDLVTATIYGEARGEAVEGKVAVGWVIKNRTLDDRWPDSFKEVILQRKQFSCWNRKDSNFELVVKASIPNRSHGDLAWRECRLVAHGIIYDRLVDNTKGSNHYHCFLMEKKPFWTKGFNVMVQFGNHLFYRL